MTFCGHQGDIYAEEFDDCYVPLKSQDTGPCKEAAVCLVSMTFADAPVDVPLCSDHWCEELARCEMAGEPEPEFKTIGGAS